MLQKFSELERGRLDDFFEADWLVGDICNNSHKAQKEQVQKHKDKKTNLISTKLVHKRNRKS